MIGNSSSPYRISGRTALSFSGGRTSAYMLRQVLDHNDDLSDLVVLFANTGKEHEATLEFVRDVGEQWGVPIVWLEFRDSDTGFEQVSFETASRNGEPFEALINKRRYLPNPVTRFCTVELKIRTMHRYLKTLGWADGDDGWDQMVGIRADENRRVAKIRKRGTSTETPKESMRLPLADAGVTVSTVGRFWLDQPFDLRLPSVNGKTLLGNCDLCFLKGAGQVFSIIATDRPRAAWWARMEAEIQAIQPRSSNAARFRFDRANYQQMLDYSEQQGSLFEQLLASSPELDEPAACFCGD
ncbi:phosphoadenosine phosphosulfate reductase family protein [Stutzerimonas nitrititolerans]|uniref:phosphoadenosine phosphosulfate reductase family protein n=1 Tax=Stutzerimonas nitrititolerans TaxID=2482751 RepID=UPI0028986C8A|nr:phosphoadenosine phosphosulfate reductase family protein [Stutzerimonas nitrititolerans]